MRCEYLYAGIECKFDDETPEYLSTGDLRSLGIRGRVGSGLLR